MAYDPDELDSDFDSMDEDDGGSGHGGGSNGVNSLTSNFASMHVRSAPAAPPAPPPANGMCVVCHQRPGFTKNGQVQPFCTLTCKERYEARQRATPSSTPNTPGNASQSGGGGSTSAPATGSLCVVCGVKPAHSKYPTCGYTCANALKNGGGSASTSNSSRSPPAGAMCVICGVKPPYSKNGKTYPTCGMTCAKVYENSGGAPPTTTTNSNMCVVCGVKPPYSKNGKSYPTCGLTCKAKYESGNYASPSSTPHRGGSQHHGQHQQHGSNNSGHLCVICNKKPVHQASSGTAPFITCGLDCLEKLCDGKADSTKCNYCHRRPVLNSYLQCGKICAAAAKTACLMCRARPKLGKYHFCGKTCRKLSLKSTPRLCEVPEGHVTWDMVQKKFESGWKDGTPCPPLKHVYKIVESLAFHEPYTKYKNQVGNEHFRYHGTTRQCKLGEGQTALCNSTTCAACNILKTSFDVTFARASGAFGAGIYTSSAVNKAEVYTGRGPGRTAAMLLNKVALGTVYTVTSFGQVTSLPAGHHSVVFDNQGGKMNETIIYNNASIRPVFFLVF